MKTATTPTTAAANTDDDVFEADEDFAVDDGEALPETEPPDGLPAPAEPVAAEAREVPVAVADDEA